MAWDNKKIVNSMSLENLVDYMTT